MAMRVEEVETVAQNREEHALPRETKRPRVAGMRKGRRLQHGRRTDRLPFPNGAKELIAVHVRVECRFRRHQRQELVTRGRRHRQPDVRLAPYPSDRYLRALD